MVEQNWIEHAYPLKQITVQLQGTRHSELVTLINLLQTVITRLEAGDLSGSEHDDDFGYRFAVSESTSGPSFFDAAAGTA
ncbi:hypothetical protein ACOTBZ_28570 [Achromobacter xylosoxidans]